MKYIILFFILTFLATVYSFKKTPITAMFKKIKINMNTVSSINHEDVKDNYLTDISPNFSGLNSITDDEFNNEVLNYAGLSVLLFTSHWCKPCKSMEILLENTKNSMSFGKNEMIKFLSIDTDENPISATEFQVRTIPTVLIFKNGRPVTDIIGTVSPITLNEAIIKNLIKNLPDLKVSTFE
jgi:thioredoxin 1